MLITDCCVGGAICNERREDKKVCGGTIVWLGEAVGWAFGVKILSEVLLLGGGRASLDCRLFMV